MIFPSCHINHPVSSSEGDSVTYLAPVRNIPVQRTPRRDPRALPQDNRFWGCLLQLHPQLGPGCVAMYGCPALRMTASAALMHVSRHLRPPRAVGVSDHDELHRTGRILPIVLCRLLPGCGRRWLPTWPASKAPPAIRSNPACAASAVYDALSGRWQLVRLAPDGWRLAGCCGDTCARGRVTSDFQAHTPRRCTWLGMA
jgi:hypothetical protein